MIIAYKRRGRKMWEGHDERDEVDAPEYIEYLRGRGMVVRKFADMMEFREDVNKKLDAIEARKQKLSVY